MAFLLVDAWVLATTPYLEPPSAVVREALYLTGWIGVGLVALWIGRVALARRSLTLALVLSADFVGSFNLLGDQALPVLVLVTLTAILLPWRPPSRPISSSYPTGRIEERVGRQLVVAAYVVGGVEAVWWGLAREALYPCAECAQNVTILEAGPSVHMSVSVVSASVWVVILGSMVAVLVARYRRAGHRERRLLLLPYLAILAAAALFVGLSLVGASQGAHAWGVWSNGVVVFEIVALIGVPLSFFVGLLHERLSYKRIGERGRTRRGAGADLERSLAVALGDPQLRVAFPVTDGYVDTEGRSVPEPEPDDRTAVTAVGDSGCPIALIRHDRSLSEEPALLTAAGSATRLILENARLQAEVRAQLLEVRESRARIVTATNEARARLERDLHDGAQQRLLAIGIALQLLRQQPGDPELLGAAESELSSALAEMRELASGIHPAVLTDLGVVAALEALAARLGTRVRLDVPAPVRRHSAEVEAAAYFSASEAITNALKHAAPATSASRSPKARDGWSSGLGTTGRAGPTAAAPDCSACTTGWPRSTAR